jgi:hypothetical protein
LDFHFTVSEYLTHNQEEMIMATLKRYWCRGDADRQSEVSRRDRGPRRVRGGLRGLEHLEDRTLLSSLYTVNSLGDAGVGSGKSGDLRYCITQADKVPGSTIQFGVTGTISLHSSLPDVSAKMNIVGPGAGKLTVQFNSSQMTPKGILTVDSGVSAKVSGVTLSGGDTNYGGAINNFGTLSVANAVFSGNFAQWGGGIANNPGAVLQVSNSTFTGGFSANGGGGIYNGGGKLSASGDTFSNNQGQFGGGILNTGVAALSHLTFNGNDAADGGAISNGSPYNPTGTMTLDHSTLTRNTASEEGGGIDNWGALTVSNSSIVGNQVWFLTGGGINNNGSLTIIASTITGNTNEWGMPDNISGNPPRYE